MGSLGVKGSRALGMAEDSPKSQNGFRIVGVPVSF